MHTRIATWIGIALSVALIGVLVLRFDMGAAFVAIALAKPGWIFTAVCLYVLLFPVRGLRWSILMRPLKKISPAAATEVFLIGFMANNLLPARLGDVARAFVLSKRERISASATFSNVMLERIFDGLTVVAFLSLVLAIAPPPQAWVSTVGLLMAILFAGAVTLAALIAWNESRVVRFATFLLRPLPSRLSSRAVRMVGRLATGLHTLKSARQTAIVLILSLVIWSAEVLVYALVQRAFGLDLEPLALVLVMAILTLGLTAPSAPGFVGVYEALVISAIGLYGIKEPIAPAFAITMHLIHYIPGTLLGLASTWRSGLKLRQLREVTMRHDGGADTGVLRVEAT